MAQCLWCQPWSQLQLCLLCFPPSAFSLFRSQDLSDSAAAQLNGGWSHWSHREFLQDEPTITCAILNSPLRPACPERARNCKRDFAVGIDYRRYACAPRTHGKGTGPGFVWDCCKAGRHQLGPEGDNVYMWLWVQDRPVLRSHPLLPWWMAVPVSQCIGIILCRTQRVQFITERPIFFLFPLQWSINDLNKSYFFGTCNARNVFPLLYQDLSLGACCEHTFLSSQ